VQPTSVLVFEWACEILGWVSNCKILIHTVGTQAHYLTGKKAEGSLFQAFRGYGFEREMFVDVCDICGLSISASGFRHVIARPIRKARLDIWE
jgi:hypothetical protein